MPGHAAGASGRPVRLFVAVWPPPDVVEALAAAVVRLRGQSGSDLRWTAPEQWHVTLRFLGQADVADASAALHRLTALRPEAAAVAAEIGPATARFGRRVLHVPVGGLNELAAVTVAATAAVGEPPEDRPFAGHLTLARARSRRGADLSALAGVAVAGRWEVPEVTLVASSPGRTGTRYDIVARVPVEGPCPNVRSQLH